MITTRYVAPLPSSIFFSTLGERMPSRRPATTEIPSGLPCEVSATTSTSLGGSMARPAALSTVASASGVAVPPCLVLKRTADCALAKRWLRIAAAPRASLSNTFWPPKRPNETMYVPDTGPRRRKAKCRGCLVASGRLARRHGFDGAERDPSGNERDREADGPDNHCSP